MAQVQHSLNFFLFLVDGLKSPLGPYRPGSDGAGGGAARSSKFSSCNLKYSCSGNTKETYLIPRASTGLSISTTGEGVGRPEESKKRSP